MRDVTAKRKSLQLLARNPVLFDHVRNEITMIIIRELLDELVAFCLSDAVFDQFVPNSIVLEGNNQFIDDRVSEA